ncbi:MAG: tRNA (cytidine(34)-2'-O)-methyltransferase [Polyangiaceae bacterium]
MDSLRLRATGAKLPFHVVLVEPEIPPNTGSIARLCGATRSVLHLVGRLGFRIDDHAVRRAGLDYWHLVDVRQHVDFSQFLHAYERENEAIRGDAPPGALHLFTAHAKTSYLDSAFSPGDALVFGKESVGLPKELVLAHEGRARGIPTVGAVRSLNLASAASIVVYEALRQVGGLTETRME